MLLVFHHVVVELFLVAERACGLDKGQSVLELMLGVLVVLFLFFVGIAFILALNCEIIEVIFTFLAGPHAIEVLRVEKEELINFAKHFITSLPRIPLDPSFVGVRSVAAILTDLGSISKARRRSLFAGEKMTRAD